MPNVLILDTTEIKRLEFQFKVFLDKAYPFATRHTVNSAAFKCRELWQGNIRRDFVNRNAFTVNSVRVDRSKTLDIKRQAATVGSIAPFLKRQETGGTDTKKGKIGKPIPTSFASNEKGVIPRQKPVTRGKRLATIKLKQKSKGANRKQSNLIAVREASKSSRKFIFLKTDKAEGIFKVVGGKRNPKVELVHDLSRDSVTIKPNPTLAPAVRQTIPLVPAMYIRALKFQIRRNGLFT